MSQRSKKKSNVIFTIFIILLILLSIGITYYLIIKHNSNREFKTLREFKFQSVSRKDTIDVFKKYPVNPIKIVSNETEFSISGLKNKEIENRINEKLNILKGEDRSWCTVSFNVSNVFSAYCNGKGIAIDLNTGNNIKLEEVYQRNSDLRKIIMDSLYSNYCNWESYCYIPDDNAKEWLSDYDNNIENSLADAFQKIYKNNYTFAVSYSSVDLFLNNDYWTELNYYNSANDITIFERFLTNDNIYENKVSEYCEVQSCASMTNIFSSDNQDNYYKYYYLNDKTYIAYNIYNSTNINILDERNDNSLKKTNYDMNNIGEKILNNIVDKYELNKKDNNYRNINIYANIYGVKSTDYNIVSYNIRNSEFNKENFIKFNLGYYEAKSVNESDNFYSSMVIKVNEINYLDSNPRDIFNDFDETLYKHIKANLKSEEDYESPYYYLCCGIQDSEGYEKTDFKKIINNANYSLDKGNEILLMNYEWQIYSIPWNIFEEKKIRDENL